jgi:SRSO17 transposase
VYQEKGKDMAQQDRVGEVNHNREGVVLEDVNAWAVGLEAIHTRISHHFARSEPRQRALAYLKGLLGNVERKNGWQLAEYVGDSTPDGIQRLLNSYDWDADQVQEDLRNYVVEHLHDDQSVLVVDETGFIKKGTKSVGVQRQYSGTAGRIENCQLGVFLAYASPKGRTFIDRELYLPKEWTEDQPRCEEAGVPKETPFQTKPQLALRMLKRTRAAGVVTPWVTGDEVYGSDDPLRQWLEANQQAYVLAVRRNGRVGLEWHGKLWTLSVAEVLDLIEPNAWQRLSAGEGAKGPRLYDWALVELAESTPEEWPRQLLFRRSLEDEMDMAAYRIFAPAGTPLSEFVRVAGSRWAIEDSFESAKGEVGLDQYEVRRWVSWYRHITLALLAHAYLTVTRALALEQDQKKEMT